MKLILLHVYNIDYTHLSKLTDTLNFWGGSGAPHGNVAEEEDRGAVTTPLR